MRDPQGIKEKKMDSLEELRQEISQFVKERDWDQFHSPANIAKSISIESAELLECFQWDEKNFDQHAVEEELADVLNYCIQMGIALNLNLKDIIEAKMKKNALKYPVSKCKGKATKYNKL
jgi:NTP pyrophosphatase (non-canonical NTP hydrolase)